MMQQVLQRVDKQFERWIFDSFQVTPEGLALYRICFAAYFLLFGVPSFVWIGDNPAAFYDPPISLAYFFNSFPSYAVLQALSTLICLLFIMLFFGYHTRFVSVLLTISLIIANSFRYSFGKIDHEILPVIVPLVMSFSAWGSRCSVDAVLETTTAQGQPQAPQAPTWPITLVALCISVGFLSAGLPKLFRWIDFNLSTHGVHAWVIQSFFMREHPTLLLPVFAKVTNPYFWEALDMLAVAFELGFAVALLIPHLFRAYIGFAIVFHFLNHLMLNIPFVEYISVYMLFLNWDHLFSYLDSKKIIDWIKRLTTLKHMLIFSVAYLPIYYLAQEHSVMQASLTASPAHLIFGTILGLDYFYFRGTLILFPAFGIILFMGLLKLKCVLRGW